MRSDDSRYFLPMSSVIFRDTQANLRSQKARPDNQTVPNFFDRPGTAVTALPQPMPSITSTAPPFREAGTASASGTAKLAKPPKASKSDKKPLSSKKRTWGRMISKIKAFPWWNRGPKISQPYNFQHIGTGGSHPLKDPVPTRHHVQMQDALPGKPSVPLQGPVSVARRDAEGTAFEEGEADSEWEDIEETRIFQRNSGLVPLGGLHSDVLFEDV